MSVGIADVAAVESTTRPAAGVRTRRWAAHLRGLIGLVGVAAAWELIGRLKLVGQGAFPSLSGIVAQLWRDRADYPTHVAASVRAATIGFLIGNVIAIICALIFQRFPTVERLLRGVGLTLFSVPLIALVPVLLIAFSGTTPRIVLAALAVYYPTMMATLTGLRDVDARLCDFVLASGGSERDVLLRVRLRAALPSVLSGLRVAAPAALLGVLLVEFGGGVRWGLGSYLLASLGRALPTRIWGIGLVATAIAASAYGLFAWLGSRLASLGGRGSSTSVDIGPPKSAKGPLSVRIAVSAASAAVVLGFWAVTLRLLHTSPIVAKSPFGVVRYLATGSRGARARHDLLRALGQTLPTAFLGLACGLLAALVLAILFTLKPRIERAVLPFALVTQTMPLPALTPLLVLVFGRGLMATLAVTTSVTFFPSLVTVAHGLSRAPQGPSDVVRSAGGSEALVLARVSLPNALPHLLTAARLAAPRALLGVMIAEYLATGRGIGNLLNTARGRLDYGMIWSVAAVSVLVALLITQFVTAAERLVWRHYQR